MNANSWAANHQNDEEHFKPCDICGQNPCSCTLDILKSKLRNLVGFFRRYGSVYNPINGSVYENPEWEFDPDVITQERKGIVHIPEFSSTEKKNSDLDYNYYSTSMSEFKDLYLSRPIESPNLDIFVRNESTEKPGDYLDSQHIPEIKTVEELVKRKKAAFLKELMSFMDEIIKELEDQKDE